MCVCVGTCTFIRKLQVDHYLSQLINTLFLKDFFNTSLNYVSMYSVGMYVSSGAQRHQRFLFWFYTQALRSLQVQYVLSLGSF